MEQPQPNLEVPSFGPPKSHKKVFLIVGLVIALVGGGLWLGSSKLFKGALTPDQKQSLEDTVGVLQGTNRDYKSFLAELEAALVNPAGTTPEAFAGILQTVKEQNERTIREATDILNNPDIDDEDAVDAQGVRFRTTVEAIKSSAEVDKPRIDGAQALFEAGVPPPPAEQPAQVVPPEQPVDEAALADELRPLVNTAQDAKRAAEEAVRNINVAIEEIVAARVAGVQINIDEIQILIDSAQSAINTARSQVSTILSRIPVDTQNGDLIGIREEVNGITADLDRAIADPPFETARARAEAAAAQPEVPLVEPVPVVDPVEPEPEPVAACVENCGPPAGGPLDPVLANGEAAYNAAEIAVNEIDAVKEANLLIIAALTAPTNEAETAHNQAVLAQANADIEAAVGRATQAKAILAENIQTMRANGFVVEAGNLEIALGELNEVTINKQAAWGVARDAAIAAVPGLIPVAAQVPAAPPAAPVAPIVAVANPVVGGSTAGPATVPLPAVPILGVGGGVGGGDRTSGGQTPVSKDIQQIGKKTTKKTTKKSVAPISAPSGLSSLEKIKKTGAGGSTIKPSSPASKSATQKSTAVGSLAATQSSAASASALHGASILGNTGPGVLLYPALIALANGGLLYIKRRRG